MGLFEYLPYGNKHGLNLDEMIKVCNEVQATVARYTEIVDGMESRVTALEGSVGDLQESVSGIRTQLNSVAGDVSDLQITVAQHGRIITSFQETLESIEGRLVIIVHDIETLYQNVERVENESKQRDNALGSRVTLLESAVINPITVTQALKNHVPFGDDLRKAKVNSTLQMPYGFYWSNSSPASVFTYNENRGILIGDNYDDSNFLVINTDCYQLDRSASYSVTIGIFPWYWDITNEYGTFNPARVLTCSGIRPEYGSYWQDMTGSNSMKVCVRPNGQLWIGYRGAVDSNLSGNYIGYIKLVESTTAETAVYLNRKDNIYFDAIASMISAAVPSSTSADFNDDIETDWFADWSGTGTEEGITASIKIHQDGNTLFGNIALISPYDDDPIGNGNDTANTIDVSSLHIPKIKNSGFVGQYINLATGEQYDIHLINGTDYVDEIVIAHNFPATITPQSNGHFATIVFTVPIA